MTNVDARVARNPHLGAKEEPFGRVLVHIAIYKVSSFIRVRVIYYIYKYVGGELVAPAASQSRFK